MTDALRLIDHPLVATLGWTLTHFVWQGAVLGLFAFFILRMVRPTRASTRYLVGVGTLTAMLIVPVATFVSTAGHTASSQPGWRTQTSDRRVAGAGMVTGAMVANLGANPSAIRELMPTQGTDSRLAGDRNPAPIAPTWLPIVTAIWMFGVAVLSVRMLGGWIIAQMIARRAVSAVSDDVADAAREMARRLRLRRSFAVLESAAVVVPTLVGWVKPVVLLPAAALAGLSPMQLQAVIAHELAHIRRHDYLINLLQTVVETLLFYHPAVWWVSSEVRAEREHCCDDLAVEVCGDRLVYVSALAELTSIERRAFALAATDGSLVTRVRRILGRPGDSRRELPPSWGILVLLVALGGGAGTYEMSADAADVADIARAASAPIREQATPPVSAAPPAPAVVPSSPVPAPPAQAIVPAPPTQALPAPTPPVPAPPAAPAAPSAVPPPPAVPPAPPATAGIPQQPGPLPALPPVPNPPEPPSLPTQRGEGNFVWSNDKERLTVKWTGNFRLSDDERDIGWVDEGATLTIADGWVFTDRVEFRALPGGKIERKYYRSGFEREFDADGQLFLANTIQRMIRAGMFAADRVARFLKQGGPDAVLTEVDRLDVSSSYVKRSYYSALLKQADLTVAHLTRMLERVNAGMTSDHEKATLLVQMLAEPKLSDEQRVLVARAAAKISSDHEQRKVLAAALSTGSPAPALVTAVLDALQTVDSGHERSTVLVDIAQKGLVTPQISARFMESVSTMSSSYEKRKVLAAVNAAPVLAAGVARESLKAAASIESSHDRAEILIQTVAKGGIGDDTAPSFFSALDSLGSSHEKYRVLSALLTRGRMSDAMLTSALRSIKGVSGNHERSQLLLQVLRAHQVSGAHRTLFLEAADTITGSHEQNQVLAALVRAERR
jgi:beta-lactamase regulating signal transducer with metallopeptidase domain